MTPTLDAALLSNSRAGDDLGLYIAGPLQRVNIINGYGTIYKIDLFYLGWPPFIFLYKIDLRSDGGKV